MSDKNFTGVGNMNVNKQPVDNREFFKDTAYPGRDWVYNKIVKRYGDKGNAWTTSDTVIWSGFLYYVVDYLFAIAFIALIYYVVNWTYGKYGIARAGMVFGVMLLWRINVLIRQATHTNRLLGAK